MLWLLVEVIRQRNEFGQQETCRAFVLSCCRSLLNELILWGPDIASEVVCLGETQHKALKSFASYGATSAYETLRPSHDCFLLCVLAFRWEGHDVGTFIPTMKSH